MDKRREKRKNKKKFHGLEEIPCIIFLSTDETKSFERAEMKENRQLKYINEYADAHGLVPILVIRRNCMGPAVRNEMFKGCIQRMQTGRAEAILVASMDKISSGIADSYYKVGLVQESGFRIFSVDEGELKLPIIIGRERSGKADEGK